VVTHSDALRERAPEVLEEMAFCIIGINERYEDYGEKPALELELR
ncbi:MAG: barnase inhibitor, partial [Betaproteobacteria bacterium]